MYKKIEHIEIIYRIKNIHVTLYGRIFVIKKKRKEKEREMDRSETLIPNIPFFEGGQQQNSKVAGCSPMITKLTLASYCIPPEKTHISSQTASKT